MKKIIFKLFFIFSLSITTSLHAAPELLLKSDQSWNGEKFFYLSGNAEITSVKLSLQAGKDTPYHCHPVPTMGYILKGEVKLETPDGKNHIYREGDSVAEVMKGLHRGVAVSGDTEIIVFYAGVKGVPNTVFPDDEENFKKYCE